MTEQTVKCPICGRPYKFYAFMAGDQSACPSCRREAENAAFRPDTTDERKRRWEHFNK